MRATQTAKWALSILALAVLVLQAGCAPSGSAAGTAGEASPTPPPTRTPEDPTVAPSPTAGPTSTPGPIATTTTSFAKFGPGRVEIPILLYHRVADKGAPARYVIAPQDFEQQIAFLQQAGYRSIRLSQLVEAIQKGAMLPERSIVLTFDDGNLDNYTNAFPILQEYGMTGVAYVVADRLDSDGYLNAAQIRAMAAAGWEIGSHSMTHTDLTTISDEKVRVEIHDSKVQLENILGFPIESFAYPFGKADPDLVHKVFQYGYLSGAGLGISLIHGPETLYYLDRREVWGTFDMKAFQRLLIQPK